MVEERRGLTEDDEIIERNPGCLPFCFERRIKMSGSNIIKIIIIIIFSIIIRGSYCIGIACDSLQHRR